MKALGSLKYFNLLLSLLLSKIWYFASYGFFVYKYILSISGWWFSRFNNALVFPDPEHTIINILYGWSGIHGHFKLCFFIFTCIITNINHFYLLTFTYFKSICSIRMLQFYQKNVIFYHHTTYCNLTDFFMIYIMCFTFKCFLWF